jgi:NADH:ubiquinone oxidoreductase subunit 5 (subunit L)/multisubunit Na+/H+ antiporter MnhA subunit
VAYRLSQLSFSKGLVITSVTETGHLYKSFCSTPQLPLHSPTASACSAWCSWAKESEHLQKQHVHEAPKVMLIPAMILAGSA